MIEGVLRHCTDMEIQRQDVDSHGQSAVGFAFCRLLGFELAPRLKAIARQQLALPDVGMRTRLQRVAGTRCLSNSQVYTHNQVCPHRRGAPGAARA